MTAEVVGGKRLPAEVLQQIVERTDGVPLFVEELTKALLESGYLQETEGHYALTGALMSLAIPATLHDSVVLENSNVAPLASNLYLSVYSLPQEDQNDTDDASSGQVYTILMPESTVYVVQSAWRRQHHASCLDGDTQAY
jgi:hypothetical protein